MPRHFDPVAIREAWEAEKAAAKQVIEEEDEDNYAASLAAYPDLTKETFNMFGGQDLSQKSPYIINMSAGSPAGQAFGASSIREPKNRPGQAYTKEGGWEDSDDPHVPVYTPDPTPALIETEERTTIPELTTDPTTDELVTKIAELESLLASKEEKEKEEEKETVSITTPALEKQDEKVSSLIPSREETLDPIDTGTGLIETMTRATSSSTIETPNADIIKDMFEATRRVGSFRTGRTGRTGPQRNIPGQVGNEMSVMPGIQDGLGLTEGPLIETIPRLRGQ